MQRNATLPVLASMVLLTASCDKADTQKKTEFQTEAKAETKADAKPDSKAAAPPKDEGPFAAFDLPDVKSKWQGAWLVDRGDVAWHVDGDKVTVFDGKAEKTLEFEVQAPCQVAVVERSDSGSSSTIHKKQSPFDNGRWESSDATCTLFEGDPQTFEVEGTTLEVVGDTLVDTQMQANVAARKASFDEAKAGLG